MAIPPEIKARNKRILIRGALLVFLLAAMLFLPGPRGAGPVMLFDTLLLTIFTMLTVGSTGPAFRFIALSSFGMTVVLPVLVLTLLSINAQVGMLAALTQVWQTLTEVDPLAGIYLVLPALFASTLSVILARRGFKLPGLKRR